jgi:hypothetical protein
MRKQQIFSLDMLAVQIKTHSVGHEESIVIYKAEVNDL